MQTVFDFTHHPGYWLHILLGVGIGIGALAAGAREWKKCVSAQEAPSPWRPVFLMSFAIIWLGVHSLIFATFCARTAKLYSLYRSGTAPIAEGVVHVIREQPWTGHAPGDEIEIAGHRFTIDYSAITPGYTRSISHGGALREGTYARVHYYGGDILKIEIRKDQVPIDI